MIANRSVPTATVIPVLAYTDVVEAADWLCSSFGFTVRLRIADHRAQLVYGEGAVIVTDGGRNPGASGRIPCLFASTTRTGITRRRRGTAPGS
jgi:hypothetical protein